MNRWRQRVNADVSAVAGSAGRGVLVASLLAAVVGMLALLPAMQIGPPVGTVLVFGPYDQASNGWQIQARRVADHSACRLNPAIMAAAPGSMVVERRLADGRRFQVHWRGGRTSVDAMDCGRAADLSLRLQEMQALVNAAQAAHWRVFGW